MYLSSVSSSKSWDFFFFFFQIIIIIKKKKVRNNKLGVKFLVVEAEDLVSNPAGQEPGGVARQRLKVWDVQHQIKALW